jgi:serine protease Do
MYLKKRRFSCFPVPSEDSTMRIYAARRLMVALMRSQSAWLVACLMLLATLSCAPAPTLAAEDATAANDATATATSAPTAANDSLESLYSGGAPESVEQLKALQSRLREIVKKVIPCTVNVQVGAAQGSGVIISKDGFVLTAAHVGGKPDRNVTFVFADGKQVRGKTLGLNRTLDAGLMKITQEGEWPHVEMGDSSKLNRGQWCLATGHPGGYQPDRKPVLRLGRVLRADKTVIVSDCTLVGGDSGGPLFDLDGKVIGINSRIGANLTANMHVPVSTYRESWDRLAQGEAWGNLPGVQPYIGVRGAEQSDEARIVVVFPGTPADKAGMKAGDIVLKFDDKDVKTFEQLVQLVSERQPGDKIKILVKRDDETAELSLVIGKRGG